MNSKEQKRCLQETLMIAYYVNKKLKCCIHYMALLLNVIHFWFSCQMVLAAIAANHLSVLFSHLTCKPY